MRKIAIIEGNHYDYDERLTGHITDFEEISEEDYQILIKAQYSMGFTVISMPENPTEFIAKTVAQYKAKVEKELKVEAKREKERLEKKAQATAKKAADKVAREKKLLQKLIEEHGVPA